MNIDVHRIAFASDSWIVIGKDGDVFWKNIPQGLHEIMVSLGSISAAAPCEVSLGTKGSYFIRFLDGTVEYSLPSFMVDLCARLEARRHPIRNISLNVDTYDCIVRYSYHKMD
jgi:hypothetical protein